MRPKARVPAAAKDGLRLSQCLDCTMIVVLRSVDLCLREKIKSPCRETCFRAERGHVDAMRRFARDHTREVLRKPYGWLLIHAMTPPTDKTRHEIAEGRRRWLTP
jgi:hypothetical protein